MELIAASSVSSREPVQLFSNHRDLFVQNENAAYRVENHHMNPLLQKVMKRKAMGEFTEKGGYLRVKQLSDGEYLVNADVRGLGGTGPITAGIVGMAVRVGSYAAILFGAGTTVATGTIVAGPAGAAAGGTAITLAIGGAGGATAVVAGVEAVALKAMLATLLFPLPLP